MRNLLKSRRGSVAIVTAIALVPVIGFVALGAEAGSWYVTKQQAQNAADAAAISGGLSLGCAMSGSADCDTTQAYDYRGKQYAAQNGFCNVGDTAYTGANCAVPTGTTRSVAMDRGSWAAPTWTSSVTGTFVRAIVSQQQPALLAGVLGVAPITIGAQAIVEIQQPKSVCALGLGPASNALTIGGSSAITGTGCALMSNNTVKFNGSANFSGAGWAVNGVTGCNASAGHCDLSVPYNYNMLPATNPLKALDTASFNSRTGSTAPLNNLTPCPPPGVTATKCYSVTPNSSGTGAYKDLTVGNNDYVNFAPGTYFFYNAAIKITGGTVTCTACNSTLGVTLVLLGDSSVSINGGSVSLNAPNPNTFNSLLSGVLIDDQAPSKSKNAVTINGGASIKLGGALYFPKVDVTYGGNNQNANTACTAVIGQTLTISGGAYLSSEGCVAGSVFKTQVVMLVK